MLVELLLAAGAGFVPPPDRPGESAFIPLEHQRQEKNFTITMFSDLLSGLERRGYHWQQRTYANNGSGFKAALATLMLSLDERTPVMIDTTTPAGGHTFVVAGYSKPLQSVFAVDPNRPPPGIRRIGFSELRSTWNSASVGFYGRAMLLPARRTVADMTENKKTVERYMEGFRKSDHAAVLSCLTDDVEWILPGAFRIQGKAAFDAHIEDEGFLGSPEITVTRLTEEEDVVVAEGTVRTQGKDGTPLRLVFCDVFEMRDGKIRRLTSYLMEDR